MILQNKYNLASLTLTTLIFLSTTSFSKTIIVSKSGPINTITKALSIANDLDTIIVRKGEYAEGNIIVDKKVTIIGEEFPVIDGKEVGEIFTVTSNNVSISGLTINNSEISYLEENAGIRSKEVRNCSITAINSLTIFLHFILLNLLIKITGNYITAVKKRETNSGNGIHLWYCKNISIENNKIFNHRDGIYFEFVRNGKIVNNYSEGNLRYGIHFMFSDSCVYTNNTFKNMVPELQ